MNGIINNSKSVYILENNKFYEKDNFSNILAKQFGRDTIEKSIKYIKNRLKDYHSERLDSINAKKVAQELGINDGKSRSFSVELENTFIIWDKLSDDLKKFLNKGRRKKLFVFEKDSSLEDCKNGSSEVILGFLAGKPGYDFIDRLLYELKGKSIISNRCGCHVHVDLSDIESQIQNSEENKDLLKASGYWLLNLLKSNGIFPVERFNSGYAKMPSIYEIQEIMNKKISPDIIRTNNHNVGLNLTEFPTLEFRLTSIWTQEPEHLRTVCEAYTRFIDWFKDIINNKSKKEWLTNKLSKGDLTLEDIYGNDKEFLDKLNGLGREMRLKWLYMKNLGKVNVDKVNKKLMNNVNEMDYYKLKNGKTYRYNYKRKEDGKWKVTVSNMYGKVIKEYEAIEFGKSLLSTVKNKVSLVKNKVAFII